jgi:hypothetical protein
MTERSSALTARSATDWHEWWADESVRVGTNWQSLISLHFANCNRLQASSSWWRP